MKDKRFFRTEKAIFIAYYKLCDYPSAKKIARHAKVSRATLYRHHKCVASIPEDHERYLVQAYSKMIRKFLAKNSADLKQIYFRTLVFILNHDETFRVLFRDNRREAVRKMIGKLRGKVEQRWRMAGNLDKMFNVYQNEVIGVIEAWGKQGFPAESLDTVLVDIMYLTRTARQRLLPLK